MPPVMANLAAFSFFHLDGRQPACVSKRKNQSKLSHDGCFAVLTEQIFSKTRQGVQGISVDIAKPLNEVLGEICLLKPVWVRLPSAYIILWCSALSLPIRVDFGKVVSFLTIDKKSYPRLLIEAGVKLFITELLGNRLRHPAHRTAWE